MTESSARPTAACGQQNVSTVTIDCDCQSPRGDASLSRRHSTSLPTGGATSAESASACLRGGRSAGLSRALAAFWALLFFAGVLAAQAPNPQAAGPFDHIGYGDLSHNFSVGVVNKPGRGIPFTYQLSFAGPVWSQWGSSWSPATNWGWLDPDQGSTGWISYTAAQGSCPNAYNGPYGQPSSYYYWTIYENWVYHDPQGVSHPFPYAATIMYGQGYPVPSCAPTFPSNSSTTATDGSGLTLENSASSLSSASASIQTADGKQVNPPLESGPPPATVVIEDKNGNEISRNSNDQYIDTLGVTALSITQPSSLQTEYSYPGPGGAAEHVNVYRQAMTVATNFGCSGVTEYPGTSVNLVTSITLADGSSYQFAYEPTPGISGAVTGRFSSITLPTGAVLHFTYNGANDGVDCASGATDNLTETVTNASGVTIEGPWTFQRSLTGTNAYSDKLYDTTVTDPSGNATEVKLLQSTGYYEYERDRYQGGVTGTLLSKVTECYNNAATCSNSAIGSVTNLSRVVTTGTATTRTDWTFDGFGKPTEVDEYGSSGSIQRKTVTTYETWWGLAEFPIDVKVEDGSSALLAETTTTYDESGHLVSSGVSTQHNSSVDYGNPTTVKQWVGGSAWLTRTMNVYDTGLVQSVTGANGATTSYTYGACSGAFPTQVTFPVSGLSTSATWDCNGGVMLSSTNLNGGVTNLSYGSDPFWRQTQVTTPDNVATSVTYALNSVETVKSFSSSTEDVLVTLDGLGRPTLRQQLEASGSSTWDSVETLYDAFGRVSQVSQAYTASRGAGPGSVAWSHTYYDALGRVSQTTDGGNGTVTYTYNGFDTLVDVGPAPSGENDKRRQLEYDGLGRLASVCEITSLGGSGTCGQATAQTGYWTQYQYNLLDKLTQVTQNAQNSNATQTRTFSYDALGRMTQEINPENGTTSYTWDSSAACGASSAGDLAGSTDAEGNTTCLQYDALHRVTERWYLAAAGVTATPAAYFVYDGATVDGVAMSDAKGRLARAYTSNGGTLTDLGFGYDAMGNTAGTWQWSSNVNTWYHLSAGWFPNGALQTLSGLPGLPAATYTLDGEGRPAKANDGTLPNNLATATYSLANANTTVNLGSTTAGATDADSFSFDPATGRMSQYSYTVNGQTTVSGALTWNANGTLASNNVTDTFAATSTQNCSFGYDDLARVSAINCGASGTQSFSYDPFGNITKTANGGIGSSFAPNYNTNSYGATNNRIVTSLSLPQTYNGDGDLVTDPTGTSTQVVYTWDAANRLVNSNGASIVYDALGRAVEVGGGPNGGGWHALVYGPEGSKLAVMNQSTLVRAWVPLPGGETAVYTTANAAPTYYEHPDLLGSSRLASTPGRSVWSDQAYAPFGENIGAFSKTGAGGSLDLNFTGQTSDTDSGLYDFLFRHYSPAQGRWLKPDPAGAAVADPGNPQTWNRYAYVLNNPASLTDPFGLDNSGDGCVSTSASYFCANFVYISPFAAFNDISQAGAGTEFFSGGGGASSADIGFDPVNVYFGPSGSAGSGTGGNGGGGGGTRGVVQTMQCAAKFGNQYSLASGLSHLTGWSPSSPAMSLLLGNDISTVSSLITGPNRLAALWSFTKSNPTNYHLLGFAKYIIGMMPVPGLPQKVVWGMTGTGVQYVKDFRWQTLAGALGEEVGAKVAAEAAEALLEAKLAYDGVSYGIGAFRCYEGWYK